MENILFSSIIETISRKINDLILLIKYHVGWVSGWRLGWEGGKVGNWEGGKWEAGNLQESHPNG